MIFKLHIDKNCEEKISAYVHERTPIIDEIEHLVIQDSMTDKLPGYLEDEITMLDINKIECFIVENDKRYAIYHNKQKYLVRKKLYELEEILPSNFERISKSAIANFKKILKFKVHISGAVDAVFKSGYSECISRRCFLELKRRYGL